jgi:hypothetical protein
MTSKIQQVHKYLEKEVYYKAVDEYLSTGVEYPELHWSTMLLSGTATGGQKLGKPLVKLSTDLLGIAMVNQVTTKMAIAMNDIAQTLADPNIEGIPIRTSKLTSSRDVEVGECLVIVQSANQKEYTTDNAAPKLREWQLEGVLTPLSGGDHKLLIKPSLLNQIKYLDAIELSRRPVWFKDNMCTFYQVQITRFQHDWTPDSTTGVRVSISLREYKPLVLETTTKVFNVLSGEEVKLA